MQGIPGSGKSTIAQMVAAQTEGVVYSTDALWYDDEGNYNFDKEKLGQKHRLNQQLVSEAMVEGRESIIVDNTNLTSDAIQPYVLLANIHGYDIQVIRVSCDPAVAKARNAARPTDRQVPEDVCERMNSQMVELSKSLTQVRYY